MTSVFIILFMFIHNISSKNDRKTIASKFSLRIASAPAVSATEFCNFDQFQLDFPGQISIRRQLISFQNQCYLCYLEGDTVNCSHFYYCKNCFQSLFSQCLQLQLNSFSLRVFTLILVRAPSRQVLFTIATKTFCNLPQLETADG